MKRIYLAGPDVFLPDALEVAAEKKRICAENGLEGVFPLDQDLDLTGLSPRAQGLAVFAANNDLMSSCDACIANCTPFRGPSMDVGTAVEIGFMHACGKVVWGYTNVVSDYADRVLSPDGMHVEAFEMADNLMIEGAIEASGGRLIRGVAAPGFEHTCLTTFAACVHEASAS